MGVANLLGDNLVHYLLFQFSGIERKKVKGKKRKEKKGKEKKEKKRKKRKERKYKERKEKKKGGERKRRSGKINVVRKMSWYLDEVS